MPKYKLNEKWVETGTLGSYNCVSYNGNKIITGSVGGLFLTDSKENANKVRNGQHRAVKQPRGISMRRSVTTIA